MVGAVTGELPQYLRKDYLLCARFVDTLTLGKHVDRILNL